MRKLGLLVSGLAAFTMSLAGHSNRAGLEVAIERWLAAVNAQDEQTLAAMMTEDVELLDAKGARVTGRGAAIRALRAVVSRGDLVATTREITIANEFAWRVVGLAQQQRNRVVHARGQALEIWKLVHGEWMLHRQISTVMDPGESLTKPSTKEPVLDRP
jgi:ketosteroid isomerase-like protein